MYVLPKGLESGWKFFRGEMFGIPAKRNRGWKSDAMVGYDFFHIIVTIVDLFWYEAVCHWYGDGHGEYNQVPLRMLFSNRPLLLTHRADYISGEPRVLAISKSRAKAYYLQHDPHHLSGLVRRLLYQFIGAN